MTRNVLGGRDLTIDITVSSFIFVAGNRRFKLLLFVKLIKSDVLRGDIKQLNIEEVAKTLLRENNEIAGSPSLGLIDYLILVKADGDNMGDMLSTTGKYRKALMELIPTINR